LIQVVVPHQAQSRRITSSSDSMDIAKTVCCEVTHDLAFGIGNPEQADGHFTSYIKDDKLAREANNLSRRMQNMIPPNANELSAIYTRAMIAQNAGIGNCGECSDLAFSHLYEKFGVGPIKKWLHPQVGIHHDNHCFVSFQCGGKGEEWCVDVWAYIVMRDRPHDERSKFGVHKLSEHQGIANSLYQRWNESSAPPPRVIFEVSAQELLAADQADIIQRPSGGSSRVQNLRRGIPLNQDDHNALVDLSKRVKSLVDDAVRKGDIPKPSNPRASIFSVCDMSICST